MSNPKQRIGIFDPAEIDLASATASEKATLQTALAVLRTGTDHADFLGYWLKEFGLHVLSPNPPRPLIERNEDELPIVIDAPLYIN